WSEHQIESKPARSTATAARRNSGHVVRSVHSSAPSLTFRVRASASGTAVPQLGRDPADARGEEGGVGADADEAVAAVDVAARLARTPAPFPAAFAASATRSTASAYTVLSKSPGTPRVWLRSVGPTKRTSAPGHAAISAACSTELLVSIWTSPAIRPLISATP